MIDAVVGDLASVVADAVVRPATTWLEPLTPALQRLDDAAGPRFVEQRRLARELAVGAAVVTGAGALRAEFVVHLVLGTEPGEPGPIEARRAMEAALWQCTQWQIGTLACPVPASPLLDAMLGAIGDHMRNSEHPARVLFVADTSAEADSLNARLGQGGP